MKRKSLYTDKFPLNPITFIKQITYILFRATIRFKKRESSIASKVLNSPQKRACKPYVIQMFDGIIDHGGLVDRLRGIISTYNYCKELDLDFRIYFIFPFDLHDFLIPNIYNWRISKEEISYSSNQVDILYGDCNHSWNENWMINNYFKKRLSKSHNKHKQVHVYTTINTVKDNYSILFSELFKPSPYLQSKLENIKKDLGDNYVSISFRFLKLLGDLEDSQGYTLNRVEQKLLIEKCIKIIYNIHVKAPKHDKVLITSDSSTFVSHVKNIPFVYVCPGDIGHIQYSETKNNSVIEKTFLDLFLISQAQKAYMARTSKMYQSGFAYGGSRISGIPFEEVLFD